MLSDDQIRKFQKLYKQHFHKEINHQEAIEKGIKLIRLIEIIYKPMTIDEFNLVRKRCNKTVNQ